MITPEQIDKIVSIQGTTSREEAAHLYNLASAVADGCIVEIGSFQGRSHGSAGDGLAGGIAYPGICDRPPPVRLLWIGGDHRYDGVRRDIEAWLPKLHENPTIVFDDALDPNVREGS